MKALVTGGSGFIGSHLVARLVKDGHSVTVIDKTVNDKIPNVEYIESSILDLNTELDQIVERHDQIFHLAALVGMKNGIYFPFQSMQSNLDSTILLMNYAVKHMRPIFFASTSEVYGTNTNVPLAETADRIVGETWNNRWGYSESKAMAERLLILYYKERGLPVKIGRFFNVAGPGQSGEYGMVMPRFIKAAVDNKPLIIYGTGMQTRSFCHVSDAVDGIMAVALDGKPGEVYNIGNPEEISINRLAETVIREIGSLSTVMYAPYESVYPGYVEIERRVPDVSKLKALGWKTNLNLKQIISDIVKNG
jgi:UDP-glucose 4-epimerase